MSIYHGARTAAGGRITVVLGGLLVHLRFRNITPSQAIHLRPLRADALSTKGNNGK